MTFLLVEILVLLTLAAVFGALVMHWWLRRQFEDVSVEYTRLSTSATTQAAELAAATEARAAADARAAKLEGERAALQGRLDDDAAWRATVDARLGAIKPADLAPTLARLDAIDARLGAAPTTDLGPVLARLDAVDKAVTGARGPELSALLARFNDLERAVRALKSPDNAPVLSGIAALASSVAAVRPAPEVDLRPLVARLADLEAKLYALRPANLTPLVSRLAAFESRVTSFHASDATLLYERFTSLEQRIATVRVERCDLGPLLERLTALEALVRGVSERPPPAAGPSPVQLVFLSHHRAGGGRNLLTNPVFGEPDDLLRIVGVGPVLLKLLHDLGVYYFWQVADWTEADVDFVNSKLEVFKGRIARERWVEQAHAMAAEPGAAKRPELGALA